MILALLVLLVLILLLTVALLDTRRELRRVEKRR